MGHVAIRSLVVVGFLALSCGGNGGSSDGDTAPPGADATTVTSEDGMLELSVPAGAVPSGTEISIAAAAVPDGLAVSGADVHVYELEPSGLEFSSPATVSLTLPASDEAGIVLGVVALGNGPDDLEHVPSTFVVDQGTLTVTSEISHFSTYVSWIGGDLLTVIDECPSEMIVGGAPCDLYVQDFDQHQGLEVGVNLTARSSQFFLELDERAEGSTLACDNPTDGREFMAALRVSVDDRTLEDLFRLVGARLEYKGGDSSDEFMYRAYSNCIVPDPFFEEDPASQIPGGVWTSAVDPTGDFLAVDDLTARGFELIEEDPPSGVDIIDVIVAWAPGGDVTEITVCFAGPAQGLTAEDRDISIRPAFRRGGEHLFSIEYQNGSAFVSGAPEGTEVTYRWVAEDKIRFTLEGFAPEAGDQLGVEMFSRLATAEGTMVQGDTAAVDIEN